MYFIFLTKKQIILYFAVICTFCIAFKTLVMNKGNEGIETFVENKGKSYIAIIIDDFGNNSEGTDKMLSLPIKFTGAVMPGMPYSNQESELLFKSEKDVILHMPMEPHNGKTSWLGPVHILNNFESDKALEIFKESFDSINHCIGFNNHMGSKVTENYEIMSAIINDAKEKDIIVVDSVTGPKSVVQEISEKKGVPYLKRDVFLDSTNDVEKIKLNLKKTAEIALKKGYAVAIGHVGAEGGNATYKAIEATYKEIESKGIEFVGISKLRKIIFS